MSSSRMTYIMPGNPGVGKSTLVNCYCQKILFKASPSLTGSGITAILETRTHGNKTFKDTPGLNDDEKRRTAAVEIEKALQEPGEYRLVFVVKQLEGRIDPSDLTTIKLIMDAINSVDEQIHQNQFSIVVNRVPRKWLDQLRKNGAEQKWIENLKGGLNLRGVPDTDHIHFGVYQDDLAAEEDALIELPADTIQFLDKAPAVKVNGIGAIDADSFEDQARKAEEAAAKMEEAERLAQEMEQARDEALRQKLEEQKKAQEAEMREMQQRERARQEAQRAQAAEDRVKQVKRKADQAQAEADEAKRLKLLSDEALAEQQRQAALHKARAEFAEWRQQESVNFPNQCLTCWKQTDAPVVFGLCICWPCGGVGTPPMSMPSSVLESLSDDCLKQLPVCVLTEYPQSIQDDLSSRVKDLLRSRSD